MAGVASPWVGLNEELEQFFAEARVHAAAPERWFTPERLRALQALLRRGAAALQQPQPVVGEPAEAYARYRANLRRLLGVLQELQHALTAFVERLEGRRQRLGAMRSWLHGRL